MSPPLREGQRVKLCSLLSKCPLSCLLPRLPSLRTAAPRVPEAGRGPEREGEVLFPLHRRRPTAPLAGLVTPGQPPRPGPWPDGPPRPRSPGPVSSRTLSTFSFPGGVGKNAHFDPRGSRTCPAVRGLQSSELGAVGGTVAPGLSGPGGFQAAWP